MSYREIRVFCIGIDGTEIFAGPNEAAVRRYYKEQIGKEDAAEDLKNDFSELSNAEIMKPRTDSGSHFTVSREQAIRDVEEEIGWLLERIDGDVAIVQRILAAVMLPKDEALALGAKIVEWLSGENTNGK
jgi:hypothetical protein